MSKFVEALLEAAGPTLVGAELPSDKPIVLRFLDVEAGKLGGKRVPGKPHRATYRFLDNSAATKFLWIAQKHADHATFLRG